MADSSYYNSCVLDRRGDPALSRTTWHNVFAVRLDVHIHTSKHILLREVPTRQVESGLQEHRFVVTQRRYPRKWGGHAMARSRGLLLTPVTDTGLGHHAWGRLLRHSANHQQECRCQCSILMPPCVLSRMMVKRFPDTMDVLLNGLYCLPGYLIFELRNTHHS